LQAVSGDDTIFLLSGYHLRMYLKAVPVGAGAVLNLWLIIGNVLYIIYLTRQPIRKVKASRPGEHRI